MPGMLLHQGATVMCSHGSPAQPVLANPRVKVSGQPIVVSGAYTISGCPNQIVSGPTTTPYPCVTATWATAATRVKANGVPVLLQDSQATCTPTGTPLTVALTQLRVKGQ